MIPSRFSTSSDLSVDSVLPPEHDREEGDRFKEDAGESLEKRAKLHRLRQTGLLRGDPR